MKPQILIGIAQVPGGEELRLFQRGNDFMIVLDRNELMNSRMSGSEEALAVMSYERISANFGSISGDSSGLGLHMLIGGYGMGFTLRAALAVLPADARVTVAELVPEIIEWARGPMADLAAGCLDDPRVGVIDGDVGAVIEQGVVRGGTYDAILLDVDNGPDGLTREANDRIYSARGLATAKAALRPGGVLAIWSAAPDAKFTRRLAQAGFTVEEVTVRARSNGKGARHTIWFATPAR